MNNIKITQFGHQGDTQWFSLNRIPDNAKQIEKAFIAESERSGSRHALGGNYTMYEMDGGFVVEAHEECVLNHCLKSELEKINNDLSSTKILKKKDHRHSIIPPGVYYVGIQQRFNPMAGHLEQVKD